MQALFSTSSWSCLLNCLQCMVNAHKSLSIITFTKYNPSIQNFQVITSSCNHNKRTKFDLHFSFIFLRTTAVKRLPHCRTPADATQFAVAFKEHTPGTQRRRPCLSISCKQTWMCRAEKQHKYNYWVLSEVIHTKSTIHLFHNAPGTRAWHCYRGWRG